MPSPRRNWNPRSTGCLTSRETIIQDSEKENHGLISRLNAWFLNRGTHTYNKLTNHYKEKLFSDLSGSVLEIGAGTGANFDYYPKGLDLWMLEPSPYMRDYLHDKAEKAEQDVHIISGFAEDIPLPDNKFDAVVTTLVLCTVNDVEQSLSEIYRVLKPGGRFHFIEHVAASEKSLLRTLQNGISPFWKIMADGCHPNRDTGEWIQKSRFSDIEIERTRVRIPVVAPHIIGSAVKPE